MWHVSKKLSGEVLGVGSLVLLAKDISCFRWEVRQSTDGIGIFVAEKWVDSVVDGN